MVKMWWNNGEGCWESDASQSLLHKKQQVEINASMWFLKAVLRGRCCSVLCCEPRELYYRHLYVTPALVRLINTANYMFHLCLSAMTFWCRCGGWSPLGLLPYQASHSHLCTFPSSCSPLFCSICWVLMMHTHTLILDNFAKWVLLANPVLLNELFVYCASCTDCLVSVMPVIFFSSFYHSTYSMMCLSHTGVYSMQDNRISQEVIPAYGHQTFQLLHQKVKHSESLIVRNFSTP